MIRKLILILLGLTSLQLGWASELREAVKAVLPVELSRLTEKDTQSALAENFKSKIVKSDTTALYLNYFGQYGDVTIGLKDGHFAYLYVELPVEMAQRNSSLLALAKDEKSQLSLEQGRRILASNESAGVKLEFAPNETNDLRSIYLACLKAEKK